MDLIDRQAAIEALWKIPKERDCVYYTAAIYVAVDAIEKLPTAEPKTGRWKLTEAYPHKVYCSICYATYVPNSELEPWRADEDSYWRLPRNFCPNCGAYMKEENDA